MRKTRKNYKRTRKNYKKVKRGGGVCREAVSKEGITFNELSKLKRDYCGSLSIMRHGKCCKQIEEKIQKTTKEAVNEANDSIITKQMFKDLEERRKNKGIEETKDVAGEIGYESFGRESI
jgi:hypothetical protein